MKYIDTDRLIKLVDSYQEGAKAALNPIDGDADYYKGKIDACENIKELIASLQQEHPFLPSNLNEAAENRVTENGRFEITHFERMRIEDIIFGAKWMAEQGYTQEGIAHLDDCEVWVDMKNTDIKDGDKVIVQIRKNDQ